MDALTRMTIMTYLVVVEDFHPMKATMVCDRLPQELPQSWMNLLLLIHKIADQL